MRIFKTKWFARFARQGSLTDLALCEAVARAERGLIDADLGGGVLKQRIARPDAGRSGGFRSLILFRLEERAFFVYGFAKNQRDNISADELREYRALANEMLAFDAAQLQVALDAEKLFEVECGFAADGGTTPKPEEPSVPGGTPKEEYHDQDLQK